MKTGTQASGPTNFTPDSKVNDKAADNQSKKKGSKNSLVDLIANDAQLVKQASVNPQEGGLAALDFVKVSSGVNFTQFSMTRKGIEKLKE